MMMYVAIVRWLLNIKVFTLRLILCRQIKSDLTVRWIYQNSRKRICYATLAAGRVSMVIGPRFCTVYSSMDDKDKIKYTMVSDYPGVGGWRSPSACASNVYQALPPPPPEGSRLHASE